MEFQNTRKQGDLGVAAAIMHFTSEEWAVSKPLYDSQRYDLIVDDGSRLFRVECKTTSQKSPSGHFVVNLRTMGGNQSWNGEVSRISADDCDLAFLCTTDLTWYLVPVKIVEGRSMITLNKNMDQYIVFGERLT